MKDMMNKAQTVAFNDVMDFVSLHGKIRCDANVIVRDGDALVTITAERGLEWDLYCFTIGKRGGMYTMRGDIENGFYRLYFKSYEAEKAMSVY